MVSQIDIPKEELDEIVSKCFAFTDIYVPVLDGKRIKCIAAGYDSIKGAKLGFIAALKNAIECYRIRHNIVPYESNSPEVKIAGEIVADKLIELKRLEFKKL